MVLHVPYDDPVQIYDIFGIKIISEQCQSD